MALRYALFINLTNISPEQLGFTPSEYPDLTEKVRLKVLKLNEARRNSGLHDIPKDVQDEAVADIARELSPVPQAATVSPTSEDDAWLSDTVSSSVVISPLLVLNFYYTVGSLVWRYDRSTRRYTYRSTRSVRPHRLQPRRGWQHFR